MSYYSSDCGSFDGGERYSPPEPPTEYCHACEADLSYADEVETIDGHDYCDNCYSFCESCEKAVLNEDGDWHKERCPETGFEEKFFLCHSCNELRTEMKSYYATRKHGESYEEWCYGIPN